MKNELSVRLATEADSGAMVGLAEHLGYAVTSDDLNRRLAATLGRPDYLVAVACEAEQVCGWVQAHASVALESGSRVEIVGLVVATTMRRRGVGGLLVNFVESWAETVSIETIVVRSNITRAESHAFYPALGYELTKTQAVYRKRAGKNCKSE